MSDQHAIALYAAAAVITAIGSLYFAWRNRDFRKFLAGRILSYHRAPRKPRPLTKRHVRELKAHSRARTSVAVISKQTKRTIGALRMKARHLGLPLGHRR